MHINSNYSCTLAIILYNIIIHTNLYNHAYIYVYMYRCLATTPSWRSGRSWATAACSDRRCLDPWVCMYILSIHVCIAAIMCMHVCVPIFLTFSTCYINTYSYNLALCSCIYSYTHIYNHISTIHILILHIHRSARGRACDRLGSVSGAAHHDQVPHR